MYMKHKLFFLTCLSVILAVLSACSKDEGSDTPLYQHDSIEYNANRKILIAYFSWSGITQHLAETIANMTGGTLFHTKLPIHILRITTNVRRSPERSWITVSVPELSGTVDNLDDYDVVFVGCPVWWHTAPMAVWSFLESSEYDFSDKIIVPFCTYSSTYREETLAKIVELTPGSVHLQGFGTTGRNTTGVEECSGQSASSRETTSGGRFSVLIAARFNFYAYF